MMSIRLPILLLLAALLPTLTGCNDSTAPGDGDLGDLDAELLVAALNELLVPLDASSAANANLRGAVEDLTDAGVDWRTVETVTPKRAWQGAGVGMLALDHPSPPLPATFPPSVVGQTFVFNFEGQQWETDDARSGAPPNGVRLIWYTVDGSGLIRFPLEERGFIDLRPGSGEGEAVDITIVEDGEAGSLTLLDFVQNRDVTDGDMQVEWFTASGFYADESRATNFDLASEQTVDGATDDSAFDVDVDLENEGTQYSMHVEGMQAGVSAEFEEGFTATVVRGGATTTMNVMFEGTGTTQEAASGTLVLNGTLLANIDIIGNTFSFTTPDGGSFSGAQANALNALFNAMTRTGFQVLLNLPLILP